MEDLGEAFHHEPAVRALLPTLRAVLGGFALLTPQAAVRAVSPGLARLLSPGPVLHRPLEHLVAAGQPAAWRRLLARLGPEDGACVEGVLSWPGGQASTPTDSTPTDSTPTDVTLARLPGGALLLTVLDRRPEAAARAQARHSAALLELLDALTSGSDEPLPVVAARTAARGVGDWALVTLRQDGGTLTVAGAWHEDPAERAALADVLPQPVPCAAPLHEVLARGQPLATADPAGQLDGLVPSLGEPWRSWLATRDSGAELCVPVGVGGAVLGVLVLLRAASGPPYTGEEVDVARDIGQRLGVALLAARTDRELAEQRRLARDVIDALPVALAVVGEHGETVRCNAAWRRLDGECGPEGLLRALHDVLDPAAPRDRGQHDRALLAEGLRNVLDQRADLWWSDLACASGRPRWFAAHVAALPGGRGAVVTLNEITGLKQVERRLSHQAAHDPLTGLPNRTVLERRLAQPAQGRALLFLDLDDFKLVNDSYGHEAGDELLVEVARRLRGAVRQGDVLVRFAGDEFVVVCDDVPGEEHAVELADELLRVFLDPFPVAGVALTITASVGVALDDDLRGEGGLLTDADTALFEAKAAGRAGRALFDARARGRSRSRLELTQALRRAVDAQQLRLHHQPVVDLADGQCRGVETLLRWERDGRLLLPEGFLRVAEEAGLMVPLGQWVCDAAVAQAAAWLAEGRPLAVAVNLSPRELLDPLLVPRVEAALDRHALPTELLRFEITESSLLEDAAAEGTLRELSAMGVGIAIDDFGTGYSSLARLRHLPGVDTLKVDRSFVRGLPHVQDDVEIVTAVLRLAGALGLVVVAEGVEHPAQRDWLAEQGCELGQGFLFSPPVPAELLHRHLDPTARYGTGSRAS